MPQFAGVNHVAFTVRDLDVSERFYCDLLGLVRVLDIGTGRICVDRASGFSVALLHAEGASDDAFDPLRTGLDHLGLTAASRDELVAWEQRLVELGVPYSPIQDMPSGSHLNFVDPDGIALELQAPNEVYLAAVAEMASTPVSDDEVRSRAAALLGMSPPTSAVGEPG